MNCDRTSTTASVVAHNGHATTGPEFNELQLWELGCLLHDKTQRICWTCTTNINHLVSVLQLENLDGLLNRTMGICLCAMTGMSTTNDELQLRRLHSLQQS